MTSPEVAAVTTACTSPPQVPLVEQQRQQRGSNGGEGEGEGGVGVGEAAGIDGWKANPRSTSPPSYGTIRAHPLPGEARPTFTFSPVRASSSSSSSSSSCSPPRTSPLRRCSVSPLRHCSSEVVPEDVTHTPVKVAIFGGGSFGTALAKILALKGHRVCILLREARVAESINATHRNCKYLSQYDLPLSVTATTDAKEALLGVHWIIHAIPVQYTPSFLAPLVGLIPATVPVIVVSKGIYAPTLELLGTLVPRLLGRPRHPLVVAGGPSFAKEIMELQPTAVSVASVDPFLARRAQEFLSTSTFRCYTTDDVAGVALGGALKNVIAIAAGVAQGLGFGCNTVAALVTRGVAEVRRLAVAMGARVETLAGLSGVGDLMLTCFGPLSRNNMVGQRIGKGEPLAQILASTTQVAEGVVTAAAATALAAQRGLFLPILATVDDLLQARKTPLAAVQFLLAVPLLPEED